MGWLAKLPVVDQQRQERVDIAMQSLASRDVHQHLKRNPILRFCSGSVGQSYVGPSLASQQRLVGQLTLVTADG